MADFENGRESKEEQHSGVGWVPVTLELAGTLRTVERAGTCITGEWAGTYRTVERAGTFSTVEWAGSHLLMPATGEKDET